MTSARSLAVESAQSAQCVECGESVDERVVRGWRSSLALVVTVLLVALASTGLVTYLAPFSVSAQLLMLLHAGVGLAFVAPYAVFQVAHLRAWGGQRMTSVMALGYALLVAVVVATGSGLVLTTDALVGSRTRDAWSVVHLVAGVTATALLAVHLGVALARRRALAARLPELRRATRRLVGSVAATACGVGLAYGLVPDQWLVQSAAVPIPAHYSLPEYAQQFDEYRGSPFAPSYARTEGDTLVRPDALAGSASCGTAGCHEQILAEWQPSAHRFAAMNPPFQAVQANFAAERGAAETRYCAGCHDPISLFAGAKDLHSLDLSAPGMQEGVSCIACHSMAKVDTRGNADYVLVPPRSYLWERTTGWRKRVSDFLIRAYPRQHLADYDRALLRTPESCASCHKQFIPEALNRFGTSPGQNQYDEWRNSHWHTDDPDSDLACRDCHMRLVHGSLDPGRGEGGDRRRREDDRAHRHHGFIATNFLMPEVLQLEHWQRHVALTKEWIRGETKLPELGALWPDGPVIGLELEAPAEATAGAELALRVTAANRKAGHNFTTGPLDFMQAWVHLTVTDDEGQVVAEWGRLDPETEHLEDASGALHELGNTRDTGTIVFEAMPLDAEGRVLRRHELWNKAGGEGMRVLFPLYSDTQTYRVAVPSEYRGALAVSAALRYRRYRQEFLDLTVPAMQRSSGVRQGFVTQAEVAGTVQVIPQEAR